MKTKTAKAPLIFPEAHPLANGISAVFLPDVKTKFTTSFRKEKAGLHAEYSALVVEPESQTLRQVVNLRLYWPGEVCYAALWVNGCEVNTSGTGSAGGGGYCKASAAAHEAIANAGFALSEPIDGRGTGKIRDAVLAIAAAVGFPEARVHVAHA